MKCSLKLVICAVAALSASVASAKAPPVRPALEVRIHLPSGRTFGVPVGNLVGVIPANEGGVVGLRINPSVDGQLVRVVVTALVADGRKIKGATCTDLDKWPARPVGSYTLSPGDNLVLSGLARYGLRNVALSVAAMPARLVAAAASPNTSLCCDCGVTCCPNPGKCIGCGDCGQCCLKQQ